MLSENQRAVIRALVEAEVNKSLASKKLAGCKADVAHGVADGDYLVDYGADTWLVKVFQNPATTAVENIVTLEKLKDVERLT